MFEAVALGAFLVSGVSLLAAHIGFTLAAEPELLFSQPSLQPVFKCFIEKGAVMSEIF